MQLSLSKQLETRINSKYTLPVRIHECVDLAIPQILSAHRMITLPHRYQGCHVDHHVTPQVQSGMEHYSQRNTMGNYDDSTWLQFKRLFQVIIPAFVQVGYFSGEG